MVLPMHATTYNLPCLCPSPSQLLDPPLKGASIDARIGGVLGDISSMKRGKSASYFDGEISDEQKKIRLYGFDSSVRKRLFEETGKAVVLGNCEVKKARHGNEYEVNV